MDGDADLVQREIAVVADVLKRSGARDVRQARTAEESEALWEARRNVSPAIARLARNKLGEDIAVPRSRIPEMVARLARDRPAPTTCASSSTATSATATCTRPSCATGATRR